MNQLSGKLIIDAIAKAGVGHIIALPDISTSAGMLFPLADDRRFELIRVCKEDEAIGISAGLSYTSKKSLILIQNTGFLDSVNGVRAVAVEFGMPICMMIGLLNKEPDVAPAESRDYGVRITKGILDVMGVESILIDRNSDVERVAPAIQESYAKSKPVAILLGRRPLAA